MTPAGISDSRRGNVIIWRRREPYDYGVSYCQTEESSDGML